MTGQREPSANARQLARSVRDTYDALIAEGFTEDQAITFLALWAANVPPLPEDPGG